MHLQVDQSRALPVGRCIYCGTTQGRLTKEHVIPKMLRGNQTLLKASCDPCAKATSQIELYAGRGIFQDVRLKLGFPMKKKPTHLPMVDNFNGSPDPAPTILIPTKNAPGLLLLQYLEPAGLLTGKPPGSPFAADPFVVEIVNGEHDTSEKRGELGLPGIILRDLEISYVGRFIAKIALGLGVTACGVDGFTSTVSDIILKNEGDWHHWVGGTAPEMNMFAAAPSKLPLHFATCYDHEINGRMYLVVQLQLICYLSTPIYTAVVGELTEIGLDRLGANKTN